MEKSKTNKRRTLIDREEFLRGLYEEYIEEEVIFVEPPQSWFTCKYAYQAPVSVEDMEKLKTYPRYERIEERLLKSMEEIKKREKSLDAFFLSQGFPLRYYCTNKNVIELSNFFLGYIVDGSPNPQGGYTPMIKLASLNYYVYDTEERRKFFRKLYRSIKILKQKGYEEKEIIDHFIRYIVNTGFCARCLFCKYYEPY